MLAPTETRPSEAGSYPAGRWSETPRSWRPELRPVAYRPKGRCTARAGRSRCNKGSEVRSWRQYRSWRSNAFERRTPGIHLEQRWLARCTRKAMPRAPKVDSVSYIILLAPFVIGPPPIRSIEPTTLYIAPFSENQGHARVKPEYRLLLLVELLSQTREFLRQPRFKRLSHRRAMTQALSRLTVAMAPATMP